MGLCAQSILLVALLACSQSVSGAARRTLASRHHSTAACSPDCVLLLQAAHRGYGNTSSDGRPTLQQLSSVDVRMYATRHGYLYERVEDDTVLPPGVHPHWLTVTNLLAQMQSQAGAKWVVNLDLDTFFVKPHISLEDMLARWGASASPAALVYMAIDPDVPLNYVTDANNVSTLMSNTGFQLWRNTPQAVAVVQEWATCLDTIPGCGHWKDSWPYAQGAFTQFIRPRLAPGVFVPLPCDEANGFPAEHANNLNCSGRFLSHFWGASKTIAVPSLERMVFKQMSEFVATHGKAPHGSTFTPLWLTVVTFSKWKFAANWVLAVKAAIPGVDYRIVCLDPRCVDVLSATYHTVLENVTAGSDGNLIKDAALTVALKYLEQGRHVVLTDGDFVVRKDVNALLSPGVYDIEVQGDIWTPEDLITQFFDLKAYQAVLNIGFLSMRPSPATVNFLTRYLGARKGNDKWDQLLFTELAIKRISYGPTAVPYVHVMDAEVLPPGGLWMHNSTLAAAAAALHPNGMPFDMKLFLLREQGLWLVDGNDTCASRYLQTPDINVAALPTGDQLLDTLLVLHALAAASTRQLILPRLLCSGRRLLLSEVVGSYLTVVFAAETIMPHSTRCAATGSGDPTVALGGDAAQALSAALPVLQSADKTVVAQLPSSISCADLARAGQPPCASGFNMTLALAPFNGLRPHCTP